MISIHVNAASAEDSQILSLPYMNSQASILLSAHFLAITAGNYLNVYRRSSLKFFDSIYFNQTIIDVRFFSRAAVVDIAILTLQKGFAVYEFSLREIRARLVKRK